MRGLCGTWEQVHGAYGYGLSLAQACLALEFDVGRVPMRPISLVYEPSGSNRGSRRKNKAKGKAPTPLTTWKELSAGERGFGVFIFSARASREEGDAQL